VVLLDDPRLVSAAMHDERERPSRVRRADPGITRDKSGAHRLSGEPEPDLAFEEDPVDGGHEWRAVSRERREMHLEDAIEGAGDLLGGESMLVVEDRPQVGAGTGMAAVEQRLELIEIGLCLTHRRG